MLHRVALRPLLWIGAFFYAVTPAIGQEAHTLSPRVGPVLDAEERAYFGLFPGVDGFAEARATAQSDSVRFTMRAADGDSVLTLPRSTAEALGRFVETFELSTAAFYNANWQLVKDYVRPDVPVPYAGESKSVTLFADGGRYVGHVAYASDSLVLLDPERRAFDWETFEGRGTVLRADEIDRVQVAPSWLGRPYVVLAGIPLGLGLNELLMATQDPNEERDGLQRRIFAAALGAAAVKVFSIVYAGTETYEEGRGSIEEAGWFTRAQRPMELPSERELRAQIPDRAAPAPVWQESYGWLSLGVGGVSFGENSQRYGYFTNFEPEAGTVEREVRYESGGAILEATAALQPLAWLGAGAGVYLASNQDLGNTDLQEVASSRPLLRLFADLDVLRLLDADGRFGLAVGGGLLRSKSRVAFNVPPVTGQSGATFFYEPDGYALEETAFEPFYQVTLSAGVARETTVYLSLLGYASPSVEVPLLQSFSDRDPAREFAVFQVDPHTVTFDYVGLSAGLRLSF